MTDEQRERRRVLNLRLLERGRELAREHDLTDPYGRDHDAYEQAKEADPEYQLRDAAFREFCETLRG